MKKLIEWTIKNHIAIIFTLVIIFIVSIFAYFALPKNVFPKGDFPRFQVIADVGFASLEETELNITIPLEKALKTVPGVVSLRSTTERGTSTIDIYLKWGIDLRRAFQLVQTKISSVRGSLPAGVNIQAVKMSTSAYPMSEYGIWSDSLNLKELHSLVKYAIIPRLIGVEGVYGLDLLGGEEPEIWVKLDPNKLSRYNIDPTTVANAIDKANKFHFIGQLITGTKDYLTFGGKKLSDLKSIENIVVTSRMGRPVYLKEIADVSAFHKPVRRIVSINGHKGLFIDVRKQMNADGLKLSRALDKKFEQISKEYAGKIHVTKWDLSDFVKGSINGILFDLTIGVILILLIVYYIMHKFRLSLPVILVLPLVVIIEFLILKLLGLTVNIMTLGGISAAIGIVADNSIVMTENYARFKEQGKSTHPIVDSVVDIAPLMLYATLVTVIVFTPLNVLSGVSGLFFKPLSITLSTTILISLLMALFVTPIFISYFIENKKAAVIVQKERKSIAFLKRGYKKLLDIAVKHKVTVVVLAAFLLLISVVAFMHLPSGFLPEWDEGDIVFDYISPTGTSIFATDKLIDKVEKSISTFPEVKMYIRKTGTHLGTPTSPPNVGEIIILLKKKRNKSTFQVIDEMRSKISKLYPELDIDFHQILPDRLGDLTGNVKPVVINIMGNNLSEIRKTAENIQNKLKKIKGLNGVMIDTPPLEKEIHVNVNQNRSALLGLKVDDVSGYAEMALYGKVISSSPQGLKIVPIREIFKGNYHNIKSLNKLPVFTPNGGLVPLKRLADVTEKMGNSSVQHLNGTMVMSVVSEISGRSLSSVVDDIRAALNGMHNPNVGIELSGDFKKQQTSFAELIMVLLVAMVLILGILLFIFESYKTALAVFIGTVLSATFVIIGLVLTHTEFDVSSFIGLIAVMGIVVNNGILVIEFIERYRREGVAPLDAIRQAGDRRFRPVLITNLAAIAGFLPMALNLGHGGEVLYPFSISMISGLIGSMFFSLVVMPVFYALFHRVEV